MRKYRVVLDYVTTVDVIVEARDEESAENKVRRFVGTKRGAMKAVGNMAFNAPDGFDIPFVEECDEAFLASGENDASFEI